MMEWQIKIAVLGGDDDSGFKLVNRGTIKGRSRKAILKRAYLQSFDGIFENVGHDTETMTVFKRGYPARVYMKLEAVQ